MSGSAGVEVLAAMVSLLNGLGTDLCWLEAKVGGVLSARDPLMRHCLALTRDGIDAHAATAATPAVAEAVQHAAVTLLVMLVLGGVLFALRCLQRAVASRLFPEPPMKKPARRLVPALTPESEYDLHVVLDLDETVVSFGDHAYTTKGRDGVRLRPQLREFLQYLRDQERVEVIVWTAATRSYARCVHEVLDDLVAGAVQHKVHRQASWFDEDDHVKDLRLLNRPLHKTIMVENRAGSGRLQAENTVLVPDFTHKGSKKALAKLEDTALSQVRSVIKYALSSGKPVPEVLKGSGAVAKISAEKVCFFFIYSLFVFFAPIPNYERCNIILNNNNADRRRRRQRSPLLLRQREVRLLQGLSSQNATPQ